MPSPKIIFQDFDIRLEITSGPNYGKVQRQVKMMLTILMTVKMMLTILTDDHSAKKVAPTI